jgi:hypothetical protein
MRLSVIFGLFLSTLMFTSPVSSQEIISKNNDSYVEIGDVDCFNAKNKDSGICKVEVLRYSSGENTGDLRQVIIKKPGIFSIRIDYALGKAPVVTSGKTIEKLFSSWSSQKPGYLCITGQSGPLCLNAIENKNSYASTVFPLH